jgi:putative transposase
MARPYSLDLRERVVASVTKGGLSCHRAAAQFGLGVNTVIVWVRFRATGSLRPGKMGGHRPKAIAGPYRAWLVERMKEKDFTLRGLVAELAERGLKVDYRTVWNFAHGEKLSKKRGGWALLLGASDRTIGMMDRFAGYFGNVRCQGLDRA